MTRLVIFDDQVRGFDLPAHAVIIGRSRRVDLPIRDALLSRKHCSLIPAEPGFRLLDLKSANGTFVNGERVERRDLHPDDVIEIGKTVIVYLEPDAKPVTSTSPGAHRNPDKVRELVRRLRGDEDGGPEVFRPLGGGREEPPASGPGLARLEQEWIGALQGPGALRPARREILERHLLHEVLREIVRRSPQLRRVIADRVRALLVSLESEEGDLEGVLDRVRQLVEPVGTDAEGAPPSSGED